MMDWDKMINAAKGVMWGLIILMLMQMCVGCKTHKQAESISLTDIETSHISKQGDSVDYSLFAKTISQLILDIQTNQQNERIHLSKPDSTGKQYITSVERSSSNQSMLAERHDANVLVLEYKRMQQRVDSVKQRIEKIEQDKKETKKTYGGVFSWSGKEVAAILALVLLIIIAWISIKTRGFI